MDGFDKIYKNAFIYNRVIIIIHNWKVSWKGDKIYFPNVVFQIKFTSDASKIWPVFCKYFQVLYTSKYFIFVVNKINQIQYYDRHSSGLRKASSQQLAMEVEHKSSAIKWNQNCTLWAH